MRAVAAVTALLLCLSQSAAALQLETVDVSPRTTSRNLLQRRTSRAPVAAGVGAGLVGGLLIGSAIGSHRTSSCNGYNNTGYNSGGTYLQRCDCSIPNNSNCAYRNGSTTTCGTGCKVGAAIGGIVFLCTLFGLIFLIFTCLCGAAASRRRPPPVGTTYGAQHPPQYGQYPQNQGYPPQGYPQAGYPPAGYNTGGYNAGPAYPPPQGWEGQPAVGVPAPKPV